MLCKRLIKKDAVKIIHDCSVLYITNLSGKNILFIGVHGSKTVGVETLFMPQNYMHLTGVKTRLTMLRLILYTSCKETLANPDYLVTSMECQN